MEKQVLKIPATANEPTEKENIKNLLKVAAYCRVSTEQENQMGSYERRISYYKEKIESKRQIIVR